MPIFIIVVSLTFSLLVVKADVQRNYVIEFTQVQCYKKTSQVKVIECFLRNDSSHQNLIDGRLELATLINDFKLRTILYGFRKNRPALTLFDFTLNGCEFLNTLHRHKFLSIVRDTMKKYLNVVPRCPFQKDFNYTLTGFHYDINDFPNFLPEAEFKSTVTVTSQKKLAISTAFWGRVVYLKSKKSKQK